MLDFPIKSGILCVQSRRKMDDSHTRLQSLFLAKRDDPLSVTTRDRPFLVRQCVARRFLVPAHQFGRICVRGMGDETGAL